ncbi:hypothetical protein D1164_05295 [Mariniphaga sediminis]|uniref:Uncharacterized protein n=1 Tax=Mariniphaga sediminis TaxID=1628158 RepID=A0A399D427_9BACT|nr:hypothetical protein D1164_05295 [Mariniphaga sediminis]
MPGYIIPEMTKNVLTRELDTTAKNSSLVTVEITLTRLSSLESLITMGLKEGCASALENLNRLVNSF